MKIIITGAAGRMGREMLAAVAATEGKITVSAAVDISGTEIPGIPS